MSRTYRRKNLTHEFYWLLREKDWVFPETGGYYIVTTYLDPKSKEGSKKISLYKSDAGTHQCKEPGPAWFRNKMSQRPLRRESKVLLQRYAQGEDLEVIIESKPPLPYWT